MFSVFRQITAPCYVLEPIQNTVLTKKIGKPSPNSLAGGGATNLFGQGGVAAGAADIFGDITSGQAFSSPSSFLCVLKCPPQYILGMFHLYLWVKIKKDVSQASDRCH